MVDHLRRAVAPVYLMLCLLLGGASLEGYWLNMILQLLALPIIAWSLLVTRRTAAPAATRQLLGIVFLAVLVVAIQLVPLPPEIWSSLPGRTEVAEGFRLLGLPLPWMPISLTPRGTIASALWLLPALAVLLSIVRLGSYKPSWLAWSVLIVAGAAVLLGALQRLGGAGSPWEIYEVTNPGSAVGFFANSNHMATLLLVCIPLLTALYLSARDAGRSTQRESGLLVVLVGTLAVIIVGLVINGSLAGLGLFVPVISGSILMILVRKKKVPWWSAALPAVLTAGAVYLIFSRPFGNDLIGEAATAEGSRSIIYPLALEAARDFFPVGSGLGSFVPVYRSYEDPAGVSRLYINHAHSDYIELFLELGIFGLIVLALFLLWWGWRTIAIWRAPSPDYFARAATLGSAVILAHSMVDYPLRTAAISALFAACCALMAEPRDRRRSERSKGANRPRHLSADE